MLVGALVTGIIQSSSASVGILQALSATGVITYGSAIPIIMGQNIGTCVTALISSVGATKNARRTAMVHLYFNIIGVTIFLFGFYGLNAVCHFAFVDSTIEAWGIAVVHSAFNILATLILLPFANGLEKLAILTIPDSPEKESFALLDERLLNTPAVAVERARSATADMAELARVGVVQAMSLTHQWNDELAQKVRDEESTVDRYEDALGTYLVKLSGRELSHADSQSVNTLLHTISDFERISDHSVNLLESAEEMHQKNIEFSKDAQEELQVLEDAVQDILSRTTDAFRKGDLHLASKVEPLEAVVNELVRAIKAHHIARLQTGSCSIEYGFVLDDLLTNYERVCDHCSNVAVAQIEVAQDSFDTHAYLNDLRHGKDTKESEEFHRRLDKYRERYLFPDESDLRRNLTNDLYRRRRCTPSVSWSSMPCSPTVMKWPALPVPNRSGRPCAPKPPELVILDVMLPGEDGFSILKKLRNTPSLRRLPIIMVTAKSSELDTVRGLDCGADDYISKPFGIMEFLSRVRAALRRAAPEERPNVLQLP